MSNNHRGHVIIVGAGLGGALMAKYLVRDGYRVDVYERRADPRKSSSVGRSINLAISTRGLTALEGVGLASPLLEKAVGMPGRMIHATDGQTTFQPYSSDPTQMIQSVSRAGLNMLMVEAVEHDPAIRVLFDHRCVNLDPDTATCEFVTPDGKTTKATGDFIIGADGAFSAVRNRMQRLERFDFSQSYLEYGYKELTIPPAEDGGFRMERNALHIWPRRSFMMIALPNIDGSFTCTCFWPYDGPFGFNRLKTDADVMDFFRHHFVDAVPRIPTLLEDFRQNPVGSLVTVRCAPWYYKDKVVLLGDAAHAIVPFFGQGANASFEDCAELSRCLRAHHTNRLEAFQTYHQIRKRNGDAIADLALANFVEMRDHTASRLFLMRKKLEHTLHQLLPSWYLPLYSMISFSNIPYADARERAARQDRIVFRVAIGLFLVLLFLAVWLIGRSM